jgi:hypothetical protein
MAKFTKTFKIGEYAAGGIITIEINGKEVTIINKEWDFSKGSRRSSDQSGAKELQRASINIEKNETEAFYNIDDYLNELTTSYFSNKIIEWIKSKIKK